MQMNVSRKCIKSAFLATLLSALAGCGGTEELAKELERTSNFTFVNALPYSADFHLQKRNIATDFSGLFDSANRVYADLPKNEVSAVYAYKYKAINGMVNLGVRNSISKNDEEKAYVGLGNNENLWVIAWDAAGDNKLTQVDRKRSDQSGKLNVRIFADGAYPVTVNGNNAAATSKGGISDFYSLDNCNSSLKINYKAIDLCAADYGRSYLLIADANGKKVLVRE